MAHPGTAVLRGRPRRPAGDGPVLPGLGRADLATHVSGRAVRTIARVSAVGFPCHGGKAVNRIGCQATRAGSQSRQQTARAGMLGEPGRRVRPAVCHRESSRADTVTPARRGKRRPRPVHWVTAIPAPNWRICVHRLDLMRRRNTANIRQLARTVQKSLRSVIVADPGSRARSRPIGRHQMESGQGAVHSDMSVLRCTAL